MGAVVAVVALSYVRERGAVYLSRWRERRAPTPMEALHTEYEETPGMTEEELSERVDDLLDPDERETREKVEEVPHVGPAVAGEVAEHFPSLEHVRQASRRDLQEVPHVGPDRADSIARFFD